MLIICKYINNLLTPQEKEMLKKGMFFEKIAVHRRIILLIKESSEAKNFTKMDQVIKINKLKRRARSNRIIYEKGKINYDSSHSKIKSNVLLDDLKF